MTTPFVGRAQELDLLERDLSDALSGHGRFALVVGEPGIGKTRLADRVAAGAAQRGAAVHWGRCWQGGGAPAFWPWIQILRSCGQTPLPPKEAAKVAWTTAQIDALLGRTLSPNEADAAGHAARQSEQARFQLFDAVASFLHARARVQPLVLVLDDLHDADEASLFLLQFLARDLRGSAILVIGTCREAEVRRTPMLTTAFAAFAREGRRLNLAGLERSEIEEFIDTVSDSSLDLGIKDAVCRLTEGNPFFVDEVVRVLLARPCATAGMPLDIPFTVAEAIRDRLRPLAASALAMLEAAAALGRDFDARLLARLISRSREECRVLLEAAMREGLVEPTDIHGCGWRFVHVLIRETLREDSPAATLPQLHLRIAALLAEDHSAGRPVRRASLTHHLVQALPLAGSELVLDALLESGREAMAMFAYEEASRDFLRAIDILERERDGAREGGADGAAHHAAEDTPHDHTLAPGSGSMAARFAEVLLELGHARRCSGNVGHARETFGQATALLRPHLGATVTTPRGDKACEDPVAALFARSVLGFGRVSETGRVDQELLALLEAAIDAIGDEDSPLHASLLARQAMALYFEPDSDRCLALGRRAVQMAERCGDSGAHVDALVAEHFVLWRAGTAAERLTVADSLIELCARSGQREAALEARLWRITDLIELGQAARADFERQRYEADAEAARVPNHRWQSTMLRSTYAWLEGRLDDAEREADHAYSIGAAAGLPNARPFHVAQLYQLRGTDGRLSELEAMLGGVAEAIPAMPVWIIGAADAALAAGREDDARRGYQRLAASGFDALPRDGMWLTCLALLSRLAARLGDRDGAARLHHLLLPHAGVWVVSVTAITVPGPVSLFLGILCGAMGEGERAIPYLESAREECRHLGYRTLVEECEAELARVVAGPGAGNGQISESSSSLGEVLFHRGADFWTLAVGGRDLRLRDSKGLRYIHYLLQNPERDFHVFDLVTAVEGSMPFPAAFGDTSSLAPEGDTGPVVDAVALSAYKQRLREVRGELAEAESHHDSGRIERLRAESDFLSRELTSAVGLGGRLRRSGSPSEQVRVRVTKVIGLAMRRIAEGNPVLGRVLAREIRTGTFCAYRPDPDHPLRWITRAE